jgi:hypothetical protein
MENAQIVEKVKNGWIPFIFHSEYFGSHSIDYGYHDVSYFYIFNPKMEELVWALKKLRFSHASSDAAENIIFDFLMDYLKDGVDFVELEEQDFLKLFPKIYEDYKAKH